MVEICPKCGLPKDLCVCQEIAKETQKIVIKEERKKFRKWMTLVEGFDSGIDIKALTRDMKKKFACGGTMKDNTIELQGKHREQVKEFLLQHGYEEEQIEVD